MLTRILIVGCLLVTAQSPAGQRLACDLPVWGNTVTVFDSRVKAYVALRDKLEAGLPRRAATGSAAEIVATQRTLASRLREARAGARQGDVLSAALATEIKKSLRRAIDLNTWTVIMGENPGELPSQVNDEYRDGSPLTTMLPNVLAALPALPDDYDIEYRFVERHLILLDTRSMVIVDRVPYAISEPGSELSCR